MARERASRSRRCTAFLALFFVAACGTQKTSSAPPTTFDFLIDFQSKEAAISADTVHIQIFDAQTTCLALTLARTSGGVLPTPIGELDPVSVCDLVTSKAGTVTVPYGTFAILVVATRSGQDWLIGCGKEQVGPQTGAPPVITLTNFDTKVQIPTTSCPSVTAHCQAQCT